MRWFQRTFELVSFLLITLVLFLSPLGAQQRNGGLKGRVIDELGGLITQASITVTNSAGVERTVVTNAEGVYTLNGLEPGSYTLEVKSTGFASFQRPSFQIVAGRIEQFDVTLKVTIEEQKVTIDEKPPVSTDPDANANALVLTGKDLDSLPDDPDGLLAALQAMAGPSAGPSGTQVYIDGFTANDRLPPKQSIKEVRINLNPFSSEFDRLGFGRIEITTRPGAPQYHGSLEVLYNTEHLNSRNPYAAQRAPYSARYYYGSLSGPLFTKRATFFAAVQLRDVVDNAIINATILDPALQIKRLAEAVEVPKRELFSSFSFDYKLNENNTFTFNYRYLPSRWKNIGVGEFSISSRAYDLDFTDHNIRMTETSILSPKVVNETRLQFIHSRRELKDTNPSPGIRVLDAFTGGGAQVGNSFSTEDRWELHNYTTSSLGPHILRVGGRVRGVQTLNVSRANFGGSYTFTGTLAPRLDANDHLVLDQNGLPIYEQITSIERYRRTLVFQQAQLSPDSIRALGGGATQLSIAGGNPEASVSRIDLGFFVQDDWRLRPNLMLSSGLRVETQNGIRGRLDLAPRLSFAWSPGASGKQLPKTVIRGGFGIFYDRISESLTLQANRFNGTNQQQYVITDPAILDLFPSVPALDTLSNFANAQTTIRMADQLRTPYTIQTAISVERQLPLKSTISVSFVSTQTRHLLRSRNVNAPFPNQLVVPLSGGSSRPNGGLGNIFEFESSGVFKQRQLVVNLASRLSARASFFATYSLNKADSDTEGVQSFPANSYQLEDEYGRSSLDVRHRFVMGGSFAGPWGLALSPFIVIKSGAPFNITTGQDNNGDSLFTDRPAFATDINQPNVVVTRFGAFNLSPRPGDEIIPRNFGSGPGFWGMNLRIEKTISLGRLPKPTTPAKSPQTGPAPERPYKLAFAISVVNLFNHTNAGPPVGNLSSSLFGQSTTSNSEGAFGNASSNRRINLIVRFNF
jgi:hypothetical protein